MAGNDLTKTLEVYFDQTVQGFDSSVVLAQQANQYSPEAVDMSRANNQFWRPQPTMLQMQDGWDTTGKDPQQLQKLSVPASINKSGNIEISLNLQEMQDPTNMQSAVEAAQLQIASTIDLSVADTVAKSGSLVVTGTTPMNWKLANTAGTIMNEQGVGLGAERSFFFSPQHFNDLTDILGAKGSHGGDVKTAWDDSRLPLNVAGFKTFQTDYSGFVAGSTANALKLTSEVNYTPVATVKDSMGDGEIPVDNRTASMSVTVTSGIQLKAGDAFTIAGVYAIHHIKKTATKRLKTFRAVDVTGSTVTYTPPLIATGPYQNVSAKGLANAVITVLNTTDESPSIFWRKNSIEIVKGSFDGLQGMAGGARFMKATTKKLGFPIAMLYWLDGKGVVYAVKWLVFYGINNLNPEMNGIVLPNQTRATQVTQQLTGSAQPAPTGNEGGAGAGEGNEGGAGAAGAGSEGGTGGGAPDKKEK